MRLVYLDELGIAASEPYVVVAGAIVHADRQWKALEKYLHDMVEDVIPLEMRPGFRFHATELYSGGKRFDRATWSKEARWQILDELVSLPEKFGLPLVCGLVRKDEFQQRNPALTNARDLALGAQAIAFNFCGWAVERWMKELTGEDEVALLIAEDNREARRLMREIVNFNRDPQKVTKLIPGKLSEQLPFTRIIDTLHFAEKADSSPLQVADACAFAIMRRLRKGAEFERFYKPLEANLVMAPNLARLDAFDGPNGAGRASRL